MNEVTQQSTANPKVFYGLAALLGFINIPFAWVIISSLVFWIFSEIVGSDGRFILGELILLAFPIEIILASYISSLLLRPFDRPSRNPFFRFLIIFGIFCIPPILLILWAFSGFYAGSTDMPLQVMEA